MQTILRAAAFAAALALSAQTAMAASENDILEARIKKAMNADRSAISGLFGQNDWQAAAKRLAADKLPSTTCVDARTETFATKYAISYDAAGAPCRIYDLSFPTLSTLFAKGSVTKVPVQHFGAHDYLAWMDGRYDEVVNKISSFPAALSKGDQSELAGWTQDLEFKADRAATLLSASNTNEIGLPLSFTAADLKLGNEFKFAAKDRAALKGALANANAAAGNTLLTEQDSSEWMKGIDNPETILAHINFKWDDLNKVYEVFLDGQFLPIRGPIALVDYSATYKLSMQRIMRNIMKSALGKLVGMVPGNAQNLLAIALNDSFMFIDMAYDYQINQLEGTLRKTSLGEVTASFDGKTADRGMNILFGGKSDLVNEYIMAAIQKKPFNWNKFEEYGRKTRYSTEKAREIMLTNLNSEMVQKSGCTVTLMDSYFGVCSKGGTEILHSMISSSSILFWNLGGPEVFNYNQPNIVLMKRSASYVLSVAAGMLQLPYLSSITGYLATSLKTYAVAGITDEAFHRNTLFLDKAKRALNVKEAAVFGKLYLQNLNLLLPKTEAQEAAIINANAALLKK